MPRTPKAESAGATTPDRQPPSPARLTSTITCPRCGHRQGEVMATDFCQFFYDCKGCGAVLRPKPGDCCVFCSYGNVPCPPIQAARAAGKPGACGSV